jgi:hypothetical protein
MAFSSRSLFLVVAVALLAVVVAIASGKNDVDEVVATVAASVIGIAGTLAGYQAGDRSAQCEEQRREVPPLEMLLVGDPTCAVAEETFEPVLLVAGDRLAKQPLSLNSLHSPNLLFSRIHLLAGDNR